MNRFLRALAVRGVVLLLIAAFGLLPASISSADHVTHGAHFSDVGEDHPEMRYIAFLSGKGIIGGYPDGRFGPGDPLNRAAATKIAVQVAGMTARQSGADPDFTDLAPSHWSVPFVRAAVESKLVTGFEDKTFRPDAPVTRAQLAALAVRATRQSTERVPALDFKDVSTSDWFYRDAALAVAAGMMELTDGGFRPNETATRAEAARAFAQAMMFTPQVLGRPLDPTVKATRGKVEFQLAGGTDWVVLSGSRTLPAGSRVRTGAASAAELLFPDGSGLYLDNLSELIIHKSLGVDLVGGRGVEELDVELVKGQVYAALTPRISEADLQAYKGYLAYYAEDKAKDRYVHETLTSIIRTRSASSHSGENLPAEVTGLMLFVDPASLEPGDAEGAELTIVLVNAAGEPVTANRGPVTIELASDLGRFSNNAPVIQEGYQAVTVQFFPPDEEPEDAKTRITALAGEISTALTVPTAKNNWWQGLFSKKTRAKVRMPWSVASVRGSYVLAQADSKKNTASFLAGGGTQRSLATGDLVELSDNQSSSQEGPDQPPGNSRPLNFEEQTQFSAQKDWIEEQTERIENNAPLEVSKEVKDENNRVKNLVVALPPDTVNPSVGISSPAGGTRLGTSTVTVRGAASDNVKLASVTVNGAAASVDPSGQWSAVVGLSPGSNTIVARAVDSSGNSSESSITVSYDAANPSISLSGPTTTKQKTETYSGSVSTPGGLRSVTVNGQPVTVQSGGSFSFTATLEAGRNLLVAEVTDQLGRTARSELEVTSASEPPLVTLGSLPATGGKALITISGQAVARYAKLESVSINGKPVLFDENGSFADLVKLQLGANAITVEARDSVGNVGQATLDVNLDAAAPQISLSSPRAGLITKEDRVTVSGQATAPAGIRSLTVNGQQVAVSQSGAFSTEIPLQEGENVITVELTGELGRKAAESRIVARVTKPPTLSISQPVNGEKAAARNLTVAGSAAAAFGPLQRVTVNGQSMLIGADGGFSTALRLENGENTITVEATDSAGNTASEQILVTFNPAIPSISLEQPAERLITRESSVTVSGTVTNPGEVTSVSVNGVPAALTPAGDFSVKLDLAPGQNLISVSLPEEAGGAAVSRTVIYAAKPPTLSVSSPADSEETAKPELVVSGSAMTSYGTPAIVSVNGFVTPVDSGGGFSFPLSLRPGPTEIAVEARDQAGNSTTVTRTVTYKPALPLISITEPTDGFTTKERTVTVKGQVTTAVGVKSVTVNGAAASVGANGAFSASVDLEPGENTIAVVATDTVGGTSTANVRVLRGGLPPNLSVSSPADGLLTGAREVTVTGKASAIAGKIQSVTVNGAAAAISQDGSFLSKVTLPNGESTIEVVATDSFGTASSVQRKVTVAADAPVVTILSPQDGTISARNSISVNGRVKASARIKSLTVNGQSVTAGTDGAFTATVTLQNGKNVVTVSVTDTLDRTASASRTVEYVNQPPQIDLSAPADGAQLDTTSIAISGSVKVADGLRLSSVSINGVPVTASASGGFSGSVRVQQPGEVTITVAATDSAGQKSSLTRKVTFVPKAPTLTVSSPAADTQVASASFEVSGTAASSYGGLEVTVNGQTFNLGAGGGFSTTLTLNSGPNTITISAKDLYGVTPVITRTVTYNPPPPPPPPVVVNPVLSVSSGSAQYSDSLTLTGTLTLSGEPVSGKLLTFQVGGDSIGSATTNSSGVASLAYKVVKPAGTHTIAVAFAGDSTTTAANGSSSLTVAREDATVTYTGATTVTAGSLSLSATVAEVTDSSSAESDKTKFGPVLFTVRSMTATTPEFSQTVAVGTNGTAGPITASGLTGGPYVVEVGLAGSYYTAATASASIQSETSVTVPAVSGQYSDTVELVANIAPSSATNKLITFQVAGETVGTALTNSNGAATLSYALAKGAGSYEIKAIWAGDEAFSAATGTGTLVVSQENASLAYTGPAAVSPSSLTFTLSAQLTPDDSTPGDLGQAGTVQFTLRSLSGTESIASATAAVSASGEAVKEVTLLAPGPYEVDVTLLSNSYYTAATATSTVKVITSLTANNPTVQSGDMYGLSATLNQGGQGKLITFSVEGQVVGTALTNETGTATLVRLASVPAGTYAVEASFAGDEGYTASSVTSTATVIAEQATLSYTGDLTTQGGALNLSATLTQEADSHLSDLSTAGTIQFTIRRLNQSIYGVVTAAVNASGIATGTATLLHEAYTVEVTLQSQAFFNPATATGTVKAVTGLAVATATGTYSDPVTLSATLTPAVSGQEIAFTVGGVQVGTAVTDGSGVATLSYTITESAGSPQLAASLTANTYYTAADGAATLQVGQESGTLAYTGDLTTDGGAISLQAVLTETADSSPGNLSRGGTVLFTLTRPSDNSVAATYTATLDSTGVASTQTGSLNNEPFTVTVSLMTGGDYAADPITAIVQSVTTVTVTPQSVDFGDSVNLEAATSPALANKQVRFTIDGRPAGTGTADGSGTVSVPYVAALASGTYTLIAWFDGDTEFVAGSGSSTLTIRPEGATLAYTGDLATDGGAVHLTASLTPPGDGTGDAPANAGELQFIVTEIDGTAVGTFTATISTSGVASTSTGSLPNQPYTVTVVLPENGYYSASPISATVRAITGLAVQSAAGEYSESVLLSSALAPAVAGKDVTFTVNGLLVGTATTDSAGVATLTYSLSTLASGTYSIDAGFSGDSDYTASTGAGTLSVSPEQATLAYTGAHFVELDGSLALAAQLTEGTGAAPGDLTKAGVVQFVIKSGGSTLQTLTGAVNSSGAAGVTATGLALQSYSIEISLPDNGYFLAGAITQSVASKSSVAVTAVQGQYADEVSLSATLTPAVSGKEIWFTVGGSFAGTALTNGAGTATLTGHTLYEASGTYTIVATFYDDPDYQGSSGTNTLTVVPEAATLTWTGSTTSSGGPLTLTAELSQESDAAPGSISMAGTVKFVLTAWDQSHTFTAPVQSNGVASTTTGNLDPRNYTVTVSLEENGYFQADPVSASIGTVTLLTLASASGQYSDPLDFYINGTYDGKAVTGSATLTMQGLNVTVGANVGSVTTWGQVTVPAGSYQVTADFPGNSPALPAVATSTLTVVAEDATLSYTGSIQSSSGSPGTLSATLSADSTAGMDQAGSVLFTIKDPNGSVVATATAALDLNGVSGTVDLSSLGLPNGGHGGYTVVTSLISQNYFTAAADADVIQAVTSLTIDAASGQYSDPVTLTAYLTPAVSGQIIQFLVEGAEVGTAQTNASGVATLTYTIDVANGPRTLKAVLAGDQYYAATSGTNTLTVSRETASVVYSGGLVLNANNTIDLEATWTEAADGSLGSTSDRSTITFTVSGSGTLQTYTKSVDSTGKAAIPTNALTNQAYEVTISASDTNYYDNTAASTTTKVKARTDLSVPSVTVSYSDTTILQATMSPAASGRTLTFSIGAQTIGTGLTNGNGVATLTYTVALPAGTYTVVASYEGDSTYGAATGGGTLTVSKEDNVSLSLARSFNFFPDSSQKALTLTATFSQQDGTPGTVYEAGVIELPVEFQVINGSSTVVASGTVTLDASGKATYTSPLLDAHTYSVSATLLSNSYYAPSSSTVSSTVNGPTTIEVANVSGVYSDGATLKAVVKVDGATHTGTLSGLVFKINGTALPNTKSTTNGVATYSEFNLTQVSGSHTITVTYPGSTDYGAATGTGSLTVSAETATVSLVNITANTTLTQPGPFEVQATFSENDSVLGETGVPLVFRVVNTETGNEVASHTENSVLPGAQVNWTTPTLDAGYYSITASLTDSGYYVATSSNSITVTVQTPTTLSVSNASGQYSDTAVLQATLSPAASGKPIVFTVYGVAAGTGYTDASGVATVTYSIDLGQYPPGPWSIHAAFAGDALYGSSSGNGNLTVTSDDATITYTGDLVSASTITVSASVVDADTGGPLSGSSDPYPYINFQLFDQAGTTELQSSVGGTGHSVTQQFAGLDPNTAYTIKVTLLTENNRYVAATATATISVATVSLSSSGSLQFSDPVSLQALFSPVASGKEITFSVGGTPIASGNTDAAGSVVTTWTPTALGSQAVTAQYTGGVHAPASATQNITIAPETVTLTTTYTVSNSDVTVTATMVDSDGSTDWSKAATATFTLNGVTQSAAFSGDTASYTFVGAATDTYTLSATLQSDYYTE